jgi:hypothetical protein
MGFAVNFNILIKNEMNREIEPTYVTKFTTVKILLCIRYIYFKPLNSKRQITLSSVAEALKMTTSNRSLARMHLLRGKFQ